MTMQEDLMELARLKEQIEQLCEEKADMEAALIKALESKNQKSVSANNGDLRGTLVKSSVVVIDEAALKKALGAKFQRVVKKVLDREKLEAEMVMGSIDPNVVAGCSSEQDRRPYILVSGTFRPKKGLVRTANTVQHKASNGATKPGARKRTVKVRKP